MNLGCEPFLGQNIGIVQKFDERLLGIVRRYRSCPGRSDAVRRT